MCLDIIHRLVPSKKSITFRRLDSVSVFRWHLLSWAQSIELVPISGQTQQPKKGNMLHLVSFSNSVTFVGFFRF
jgi:hypothetical protein